MKKIFITVVCLFTAYGSFAQKTYEILTDSSDNNAKMLRGEITKEDINNDTAFKWYAESLKIYTHPDSSAVSAFSANKDKIYFIVFGGTWCEDTHFIIPKFFKIQESSGFPENRILLYAVDRHKHAISNIAQAMNIKATPTIIVMKDGKEMGRLVEYGKTGYWDKELAKIINSDK
jgi:thiol-disulfide isomerase/thioredoxin